MANSVISKCGDYLELAKPRLVSLTLWSAAAGFLLGNRGPFDTVLFIKALCGAALVAAGSMALNEWWERAEDAKMTRTQNRPLPAGRMAPREAVFFGSLLSAAGFSLLYFGVHFLSALLAFATWFSYLAVYTPLKKRTPWNTLIGAIPGALPPLIGWSAAAGQLNAQAWGLFAIIFFWQMPHFYAISWFCRKDYEAAGFRMLAVEDSGGKRVAQHLFFYHLLMIPVSTMPYWTGLTSMFYFWVSLAMGSVLTVTSVLCLMDLNRFSRIFFRVSLLYLTLLFILMVADKQ